MPAAKKKPAIDPKLAAIMAEINKDMGLGTIVLGSDIHYESIPRITSGSLSLDVALGGGWTINSWHEIYGDESCLASDTLIPYQVREAATGRMQNDKGGSIERLHHRFHGIPMSGQGSYQRPQTVDADFFLASVNEEDRIIANKISNVIFTGAQECFKICTVQGHQITATKDHKFYTGEGFLPLKDLHPGQTVFIHNGTRFKTDAPTISNDRKYLYVRYHPVARRKIVRDLKRGYVNEYFTLLRSRAVVEAHLNGLTLDEYVDLLNDGTRDLISLPRSMHVHHKDEDHTNDDLGNLMVITPHDHGVHHATERHNDLRFICIPDEVLTVHPVGVRNTYDIKMESPYNNFVANRFIVHNSGKTAVVGKTIAANQAIDPDYKVLWIASEEFVPAYAKKIGMDLGRTIVYNDNAMEPAYGAIIKALDERIVDAIVVDSMPALVPIAEDEGDMANKEPGTAARLNNKFFRKQGAVSKRSLIDPTDRPVTCFVINQWREKIGVMWGDPRTTPGGKGKNFTYFTRTELKRDEWIIEGTKSTATKVGITIKALIKKNKTAPPERVATFDFYFADSETGVKAGNYDPLKEILALGRYFEVITMGGGGIYTYKDTKWKGQGAVMEQLRWDLTLQEDITHDVMASVVRGKPLGEVVAAPPEAPKAPKSRPIRRVK